MDLHGEDERVELGSVRKYSKRTFGRLRRPDARVGRRNRRFRFWFFRRSPAPSCDSRNFAARYRGSPAGKLGSDPGGYRKDYPPRGYRVQLSSGTTLADRLRTGRTARWRDAYRGLANIDIARVQLQAELCSCWTSVLRLGDAAGTHARHLFLHRFAESII